MSLVVATLPAPSAIYREEQRFGWWAYAALGVVSAMAWAVIFDRTLHWPDATIDIHGQVFKATVLLGLALPPLFVVGFLRMTTLVLPHDVRIWFGIIPTYRKIIPLDAITSIEVVTFRPIRDGWGNRLTLKGDRILNARGCHGVRISLRDGSSVVVGSQRPDDLAATLHRAVKSAH